MPPRSTPFNERHLLLYGLKICERDTATKAIVSVSCRFCVHFGREEKIGAKRKATSNIQYFRRPFRADVYNRHMRQQHPVKWEQYCSLAEDRKATFFEANAPVVHRNTIRSHFGGSQQALYGMVNKSIVDVIIGEMLFHPDDGYDDVTKERALAVFEDVVAPEENVHYSDLQTD